jgi:hypothetical protein
MQDYNLQTICKCLQINKKRQKHYILVMSDNVFTFGKTGWSVWQM